MDRFPEGSAVNSLAVDSAVDSDVEDLADDLAHEILADYCTGDPWIFWDWGVVMDIVWNIHKYSKANWIEHARQSQPIDVAKLLLWCVESPGNDPWIGLLSQSLASLGAFDVFLWGSYIIALQFWFDSQGKVKGNLLTKLSTAYKDPKTACRVVRALIKRTPGVALKIPIDVCEVHVKLRRPIRVLQCFWPVLSINGWVHYLVASKPQLLLAGHARDGDWHSTFTHFWRQYQKIEPNHPIFTSSFDPGTCVPYYIHGDEGRGQLKRPYMVISWQCLIGMHGLDVVNDTSCAGSIKLAS